MQGDIIFVFYFLYLSLVFVLFIHLILIVHCANKPITESSFRKLISLTVHQIKTLRALFMTMAGDKERYHRDHSLAESLRPIDHLPTQILKEN